GDRLILKLFRRQQAGPNPDIEIGSYLTANTHFDRIPPFAGAIEYAPASRNDAPRETSAVAMLQGLVPNEGDGWGWTIEEMDRYYEKCARLPFPQDFDLGSRSLIELSEQPVPALARDHIGAYLES